MAGEKASRPLAAGGGYRTEHGSEPARRSFTTSGVVLHNRKRGKLCAIAKLVVAEPLGQLVLAMPYRNRQAVQHVSLPPMALRYAREWGARLWVVRLDATGECYALPLRDVEAVGWLHPSEGRPEWFVPLDAFRAIPWQSWAYVERCVTLEEPEEVADAAPAVQLELGLEVPA